MKTFILSALCSILITGTASSGPVVQNGDFEGDAPNGLADGWQYTPADYLTVAKDETGNSFLKLVKNEDKWFAATQILDLQGAPKTLLLEARIKLKGFQLKASQPWKCPRLGVEFIEETGDGPVRLKEKGIHLTADSGDDWLYMYRLVTVPPRCRQMELIAINDATAGEIHFDDISVTLDPPVGMLSRQIINTAGTFEVRTDEEKPIYGYRAYRGDLVQIKTEGGNSFMSLTGSRDKTTLAGTVMSVDPAWKKLKVTCRMRSEDLVKGFSPSHTAKLVLELVDAEEKKLEKWITPIQLKENTPEWTEMKTEFALDSSAKGLRIAPSISQCEGTAHFDDIKVEVVE